MDVAPESEEDEDTIIERRRQLRQAIVSKYHHSAPTSPQEGSSPAHNSDADSDAVIGELLEEEEGQDGEEGEGEGLVKDDPKEAVKEQEELKRKKTSLSALREAVNGDMFTEEDLFKERQLVR